jgi:hypothetical protein
MMQIARTPLLAANLVENNSRKESSHLTTNNNYLA